MLSLWESTSPQGGKAMRERTFGCEICGQDYAVVLQHPTKSGEIMICKEHSDLLNAVQKTILIQLLGEAK
jgi:hypothetical protein